MRRVSNGIRRKLPVATVTAFTALLAAAVPPLANPPGAMHCYNDVCHRVLTLHETAMRIGRHDTVIASFYGPPGRDPFNPRAETSSGEMFSADRDDNVASPVYPDGTRLLLWYEATGHAASVRVNNAGPYRAGRLLDASEKLARKLSFAGRGLARLHIVVIGVPTPEEAEYRRGRTYPPVPGYLGRFLTVELALDAAALASPTPSIATTARLEPGLATSGTTPHMTDANTTGMVATTTVPSGRVAGGRMTAPPPAQGGTKSNGPTDIARRQRHLLARRAGGKHAASGPDTIWNDRPGHGLCVFERISGCN